MEQERCTKVMPFLYSGTSITILIKFTRTMGTSFTDWSLVFHETSFIFNTLLSYPCERRCTPLTLNSYAESSKLFTHAMFQLVTCKMASLETSFRGPKQWKLSVLNQEFQEAMSTPFYFLFHRTIQIHFKFLMSAHIALNQSWQLSSTIPLTRFPHCPTRHYTSLDIQLSAPSICSPYSHNLVHPNLLFSSLRDALQGRHFPADNKLKCNLHDQHFCQDFCATGIQCQKQRRKSYVNNEGDFVDK